MGSTPLSSTLTPFKRLTKREKKRKFLQGISSLLQAGGQDTWTFLGLKNLESHLMIFSAFLIVLVKLCLLGPATFLWSAQAFCTIWVLILQLWFVQFFCGFDRQMADKIGDYMESEGVRFVKECVPEILEKTEDGKIKVSAKYNDGTTYEDYFDTVVFAVGRNAETSKIGIEKAGVIVNPKNGKILHDDSEKTNVDHIYAIGDVLDGKPELTPVAIQAGLLLARRLCGVSAMKTNYDNVPTTVFTSLEYGSCGLGEEDAISRFGDENLEVYHKNFWPL